MSADIESLRFALTESLATVDELMTRPKIGPHLRIFLESVETASAACQRLGKAAAKTPAQKADTAPAVPIPSSVIRNLIALGANEICPRCGGLS